MKKDISYVRDRVFTDFAHNHIKKGKYNKEDYDGFSICHCGYVVYVEVEDPEGYHIKFTFEMFKCSRKEAKIDENGDVEYKIVDLTDEWVKELSKPENLGKQYINQWNNEVIENYNNMIKDAKQYYDDNIVNYDEKGNIIPKSVKELYEEEQEEDEDYCMV